MKKTIILTSVVVSIGSASAFAQTRYDSVEIKSIPVTENVYTLEGLGGNVGVLTGKDGVLLIDDQFAPLSEKIKAAVGSFNSGEVRVLINTHLHGDHSGGNENFKKWGAILVAHDHVLTRMRNESERDGEKIPPKPEGAWPMITFPDQLNFYWNDQDISAYHFARGHTDGDVIIHFKQANVFHMGDIFVRYGFPYIDLNNGGSASGMISFLDKAIQLMDDQTRVIPGHGKIATKQDVIQFRDRLKDIYDQVAAALKQGKKVEDIPGLGITDKYEADWGGNFISGKDFALTVAESIHAEMQEH